MSIFANSGDPQKLHGDVEEILLLNPDVELVSIDALTEADRREVESQCLSEIGQAMHEYHDGEKCFPPVAIQSADGKPLNRWPPSPSRNNFSSCNTNSRYTNRYRHFWCKC